MHPELLAGISSDLGHIIACRTGGGSAANVAKGLANLLGSEGCVEFAGRIGSDVVGK